MEIDKGLLQEIKEYCKLNGIKDVKSQVNSCLRYGFNVLKFGDNPFKYHNPMEDMVENNSNKKEEVKATVDERTDKNNQSERRHGKDVGEIHEDVQSTRDNEIKQDVSDGTVSMGDAVKKPKRKIRIIKS